MKEIRFRIFDGEKMIYPTGQDYVIRFDGVVGKFNGKTYDTVDDPKVMQFTGQSDITGKDIYAGDILRTTDEGEFGDINHYYVVTWISEWAIFAVLSHYEHIKYLDQGAKDLDETMFRTFNIEEGNTYTVCANIYEHPDYIKNCMIAGDESMEDEFKDNEL